MMTKKEYDKITELLNKRKEYNDLIVGLINANRNEIRGAYSDSTFCYRVTLKKEDVNNLQDYFNKKLDDINKDLKELGYND